MGTLSQLLRWRTEYILKNTDGTELKKVWIRVIGDHDLQEAYKLARVASAEKRARLRDVDSIDYKDEVLSFLDADAATCRELIRASKENSWTSQALSIVVRPDEAKISEIAVDPDAPTLEEQEKQDALNKEIEEKYQKSIEEYVAQKRIELDAELDQLELKDIQRIAQAEASVLLPLITFMNELLEQKVWRAVYEDKELTIHGFDSIEDFRATKQEIRDQLLAEYTRLEQGLDGLKN